MRTGTGRSRCTAGPSGLRFLFCLKRSIRLFLLLPLSWVFVGDRLALPRSGKVGTGAGGHLDSEGVQCLVLTIGWVEDPCKRHCRSFRSAPVDCDFRFVYDSGFCLIRITYNHARLYECLWQHSLLSQLVVAHPIPALSPDTVSDRYSESVRPTIHATQPRISATTNRTCLMN